MFGGSGRNDAGSDSNQCANRGLGRFYDASDSIQAIQICRRLSPGIEPRQMAQYDIFISYLTKKKLTTLDVTVDNFMRPVLMD